MSAQVEPESDPAEAFRLLKTQFDHYTPYAGSVGIEETYDEFIKVLRQRWRLANGQIITLTDIDGLVQITFAEDDSYLATPTELTHNGEPSEYAELEQRLIRMRPLLPTTRTFGLIDDDGTVLGLIKHTAQGMLRLYALTDRAVPLDFELLMLDIFWHLVDAGRFKPIDQLMTEAAAELYSFDDGTHSLYVWLPTVSTKPTLEPHFVPGVPYGYYPHGIKLDPERYPDEAYPTRLTLNDVSK